MLTIKERMHRRKKRMLSILDEKEINQAKGAGKIGVSQPTFSRIVNDPGRLTIEQAFRLGLSDTDICRLKNCN
jgi:plasmid maintenance system antidote protein VapI